MSYGDYAAELLRQDRFLLLTHKNPDGDTIGSASALCSALRRMGKTAYLRRNDGITSKYLPFMEQFLEPEGYEAEYFLSVDVATEGMLGDFNGCVNFSIDHHPTNTEYAGINVIEAKKSACGEAVMNLILAMCGNLSKEEATLLYIAVSTDTGCFQYANTNADTFRCGAKLLEAGADNVLVNTIFFRKVSAERMRLETQIYSAMHYYYDSKVVVSFVTRDMVESSGAKPEDMEDLANLATRVEGSVLCITIKEMDNGGSKISVRSSDGYSSIAVCEPFGGGGHFNASGCSMTCAPLEAEQKLMNIIKGMFE